MALLQLHSSCMTSKPHHLLHRKLHPYTSAKPKFTIVSQNSPQSSSKPTISDDENPSDKKGIPSPGQGFGPAQIPKPNSSPPSSSSVKKKGRSIVRRNPVGKPAFLDKKSEVEETKAPTLNESAFLLTWLGLGGLIFVEGIALAASGFLPEEWDKLFVKFIYPSFTPTVFLFLAVSVVYGVIKYFENENARDQK